MFYKELELRIKYEASSSEMHNIQSTISMALLIHQKNKIMSDQLG